MWTRCRKVRAWGAVVLMGLMFVGCAALTGRQDAGEAASDTAITAKVKSSFAADPLLSASAIGVTTSGGVVHLTGSVKSEQERQRAIQLIQGVAGVREIVVRGLGVQR
jgi:hyperosmotically inducible periplasmic protein